jgi:uncharacterized membrane protein
MKVIRKFWQTLLMAAVIAAALAPSSLLACATCHGRSDSLLAKGMNAGIFTLMGVIVTVLTAIALFFVHIVRKEESKDSASNSPPSARPTDP